MRKVIYALGFTALALALGGVSRIAAAPLSGQDDDPSWQMLTSFNAFLNDHPWIAKKLRENPRLVNDNDFLKDNHELPQWLDDHPDAREEFKAHPREFMRRERDFELYGRYQAGGDAKRAEVARFEAFLDRHGEIREDLFKHPDRVRRPEYQENHPALREFLASHPGVRDDLLADPRAFVDRVRDFERHEGDER